MYVKKRHRKALGGIVEYARVTSIASGPVRSSSTQPVKRAMSGLSSRPAGKRIGLEALGAVAIPAWADYTARPPRSTPPVKRSASRSRAPGRPRSMGGLSSRPAGNPISLYALGDDAATQPGQALQDPQWAKDLVTGQQAMVQTYKDFVKREEFQRYMQIAATLSIPLAAAIWRAIGLGRRPT